MQSMLKQKIKIGIATYVDFSFIHIPVRLGSVKITTDILGIRQRGNKIEEYFQFGNLGGCFGSILSLRHNWM